MEIDRNQFEMRDFKFSNEIDINKFFECKFRIIQQGFSLSYFKSDIIITKLTQD